MAAVEPAGRDAFALAIRRQRGRIALLAVLAFTTVGTALATPALLSAAVDAALRVETNLTALLFGAMVIVDALVVALSILVGTNFNTRATANLRHGIVRDILARGLREPARAAVGDVLSRLSMDAPGVGHAVSAIISTAVAVVITAGALVALGLIDWVLVVVFLVGALVLAFVLRTFVGQVTDVFTRYREAQAALSARLVDALTGARTIRACGSLDREIERVLVPVRDLSSAGRQSWEVQRSAGWKTKLIFPLLEIGILAIAGMRLVAGVITPGELLAVVGYVHLALGIFDQIDELFELGESRASARRTGELLGAPGRTAGGVGRPRHGAIQLAGVTVHGGAREPLDAVDLYVPAGQSVAVVGADGSGKSTLALVAGGLIAPDRGTVRIGGVAVNDLAPAELRRVVAYAFERPELLGATVDDAIALGAPDCGPVAIVEAASAAQAHHFIARLPYGYHTPMDRAPMSGGEAQRLGLARAFAHGELVLILDDATASLDTATEARVAAALDRIQRDRTCLIVTHRPATAARADRVVWLEAGRPRAVGPHHHLWLHPEYRALFAGSADAPAPAGVGHR